MTTPILVAGAEHGLASIVASGGGLADSISGTPAVSSLVVHSGSYAFRFNPSAAVMYWQRSHTGAQYQVGSLFIRFNGSLPSADIYFVYGTNSDGHMALFFRGSLDKKLYAGKIGLGSPVAGPTIVADTWYRIDYRFYVGGTTHTTDWSVDGTAQTQYSVSGRTATTISAFRVGVIAAATCDLFVDDIVVSITQGDYPIGDHSIEGLRPGSDGTHNNAANIMEDSAGNDIDGSTVFAFDKLEEDPWVTTANADYVRQTGNGTGNYCEVNFADTSQSAIIGVQAILQYASAATQANKGACIIIDEDSTQRTIWGAPGLTADYSESSAFYKTAVIPAPAGGWDQAAVNALKCRFGYSDDADPDPYWLALILEVAYSPSTPPSPGVRRLSLLKAGH